MLRYLVRGRLAHLRLCSSPSSAPQARTKLKLVCEYDGTNYSGWAKSPTNLKPCVHGTIEASWRKLFPQTQFLVVKASSRTDAGVSALGQVVTIESDVDFGDVSALGVRNRPSNAERRLQKISARVAPASSRSHINSDPGTVEELSRRLNSFLPPDIVLHASTRVPLSFDAKEHSLRRKYRYEILNRKIRSAIGRKHVWHVKDELDMDAMQRAAQSLVGTHNMSCFCPAPYLPEDPSKVYKTIELVR